MKFKRAFGLVSSAALLLSVVSNFASVQTVNAQDPLVIYSNSLTDEREEWIEERATEAGFNLEYVSAGGGDILNRLLAEKNAPQADITFGMDESSFMQLSDENLLVEHVPSWISSIPEDANIGEGFYHPLVEQRIFMIYNAEFVAEDQVPSNWQDLAANDELDGMYRVPPELGGGTNQKAILSILLQYIDEEGELGIAQEGWDQVELYLANGYQTPDSEDVHANFADGTVPLGYHFSSGIPSAEETYGFTATPINPEQGVITMREQIGVINKGEDHDYDNAKAFVDWFGSDELQAEWAEEFGSLPVSTVAYESTLDRIKEIAEATTPMEVDWNFVRENIGAWIEKVELELMPL